MDGQNDPKAGATEATATAPPPPRARHAGGGGAVAGPVRRFSARRKLEAFQRLLRGESLEVVSRDQNVRAHRLSEWRDAALLGTRWSALFHMPPGFDAAPVTAAMQEAVAEVDAQMSTWKPDSNLMRINATSPDVWVNVPMRLMAVLEAALDIGRASGGGLRHRRRRCGSRLGLWPRTGQRERHTYGHSWRPSPGASGAGTRRVRAPSAQACPRDA